MAIAIFPINKKPLKSFDRKGLVTIYRLGCQRILVVSQEDLPESPPTLPPPVSQRFPITDSQYPLVPAFYSSSFD